MPQKGFALRLETLYMKLSDKMESGMELLKYQQLCNALHVFCTELFEVLALYILVFTINNIRNV